MLKCIAGLVLLIKHPMHGNWIIGISDTFGEDRFRPRDCLVWDYVDPKRLCSRSPSCMLPTPVKYWPECMPNQLSVNSIQQRWNDFYEPYLVKVDPEMC